MKTSFSVALILLLSGCAGFQAAREVNSGRQAYLIGNNETAYAHFQKAAEVTQIMFTVLRYARESGVTLAG
jgi:Flp pilus assembly protein TadD